MDNTDISLLRELERGLPLVPAPFEEIGKRWTSPSATWWNGSGS